MQAPKNYEKDIKGVHTFKINIHDPMSSADLRGSGINVMAGYETTFLISPSQIAATDEVKSLPFYKRNCLFPDETKFTNTKLIIFKYYAKTFLMKLSFLYDISLNNSPIKPNKTKFRKIIGYDFGLN